MPSKEYRILVNGLIVNREYTSRNHKIMIDIFEEKGLPYKTEIVDLDYNVQIFQKSKLKITRRSKILFVYLHSK